MRFHRSLKSDGRGGSRPDPVHTCRNTGTQPANRLTCSPPHRRRLPTNRASLAQSHLPRGPTRGTPQGGYHAHDLGRQATLLRRHLPPQLPEDRRLRRRPVARRHAAPPGQRRRCDIVVQQVGHHDLPAGRPVAHRHVRPEAGRPGRVSAASSSRSRPTCPGVDICEHFPLQAQMWDKFACIRSLVAAQEHSDHETHTGYSEADNRAGPPPVVRLPSSRSCAAATSATSRPTSACAACRAAWSRASWASLTGPSRRAAPAWTTCAWPAASTMDRFEDRKNAARRLRLDPPRHRRQRHHEGPG